MNNIETVKDMLTNSKLVLSAIVNNNSLDIFKEFKWKEVTQKELDFYKNLEIIDVEETYDESEDDVEGDFFWYHIDIKYNKESIHIYLDENNNLNIF